MPQRSFSSGNKYKKSEGAGDGVMNDSSPHSVAADITTLQVWATGLAMARYHTADELPVAAFFDACFSVLHVLLIKTLSISISM